VADEDYLHDWVAVYSQKVTDFESYQQLCTEELEAIAKYEDIADTNDFPWKTEIMCTVGPKSW